MHADDQHPCFSRILLFYSTTTTFPDGFFSPLQMAWVWDFFAVLLPLDSWWFFSLLSERSSIILVCKNGRGLVVGSLYSIQGWWRFGKLLVLLGYKSNSFITHRKKNRRKLVHFFHSEPILLKKCSKHILHALSTYLELGAESHQTNSKYYYNSVFLCNVDVLNLVYYLPVDSHVMVLDI